MSVEDAGAGVAAVESFERGVMSPQEVVRAFYAGWDTSGFRPTYVRWLHPEVVQENTGRPARQGKKNVLAALDHYVEIYLRPHARVELLNIATTGNVVFTERREHCYHPSHDNGHDGHFASVFVIEDGLIKRWAEFWGDDPSAYSFGSAVPRPETYRLLAQTS